jgi:hypothetical protein
MRAAPEAPPRPILPRAAKRSRGGGPCEGRWRGYVRAGRSSSPRPPRHARVSRRGPHRPGVVKRLRRSCPALRPLRGDAPSPTWLLVVMVFAAQSRLLADFRQLRSCQPSGLGSAEPSSSRSASDATGEAGLTLTASMAQAPRPRKAGGAAHAATDPSERPQRTFLGGAWRRRDRRERTCRRALLPQRPNQTCEPCGAKG